MNEWLRWFIMLFPIGYTIGKKDMIKEAKENILRERETQTKEEAKIKQKIKKIEIDNYIHLLGWLYEHHKDVLREYEAEQGKLRVEFAE